MHSTSYAKDEKCPFNALAGNTCPGGPTRLAVGLGLESALVRNGPSNLRRKIRLRGTEAPSRPDFVWVPRYRVWRRIIRLHTQILLHNRGLTIAALSIASQVEQAIQNWDNYTTPPEWCRAKDAEMRDKIGEATRLQSGRGGKKRGAGYART